MPISFLSSLFYSLWISYVCNTESHRHVDCAENYVFIQISFDILTATKLPTLNYVSNVLKENDVFAVW